MHADTAAGRRPVRFAVRPSLTASVTAFVFVVLPLSAAGLSAQKDDKDDKDDRTRRPSLSLKASPTISFSPARVVVSAELRGGSETDADLYCPAVEWDWGDGTKSESNEDCEPFEAGRSEIRRRWTTTHTYTMGGNYRVQMRLKREGRSVLSGNTTITVRPGLRDGFHQP